MPSMVDVQIPRLIMVERRMKRLDRSGDMWLHAHGMCTASGMGLELKPQLAAAGLRAS